MRKGIKSLKKTERIQVLWDNIKWNSRMRRKNQAKQIFEEIMAKKFPKLVKDTERLIQEDQKI